MEKIKSVVRFLWGVAAFGIVQNNPQASLAVILILLALVWVV